MTAGELAGFEELFSGYVPNNYDSCLYNGLLHFPFAGPEDVGYYLDLLFYDAAHPTNEEKSALYAREQEVASRFRAAFGTIICRELLEGTGADDAPQAEERTAEYYAGRPCAGLCAGAAKILQEYLAEEGVLPAGGEGKQA